MAKLYRKIILLICPIILWFIVFLCFDEYDLSGIRATLGATTATRIISADGTRIAQGPYGVVKYIHEMTSIEQGYNVILGDSRSGGIDVVRMKALSGMDYINLSWGGCTLEERIDEFWYIVQRPIQVNQVVFQLDYYAFNSARKLNRMDQVISVIEAPVSLRYYFDFENNLSMLRSAFGFVIASLRDGDDGKAEEGIEEENYRFDTYYPIIYGVCASYKLDEGNLEKLIEIAKYCDENSIEILFISPPLHRSIWDNVIAPLELFDEMNQYKAALSEYALVYDMEYPEGLSERDEDWTDGHHFAGGTMEQLEKNVLGIDDKYMKIWEGGKQK